MEICFAGLIIGIFGFIVLVAAWADRKGIEDRLSFSAADTQQLPFTGSVVLIAPELIHHPV